MKKKYAITKEVMESFPLDVQAEIMDMLKAYKTVEITFCNGKYDLGGLCIMCEYPADYKYIGTAYAEDFYTLGERTENYIEVYHDYPSWYTGKRDYIGLKKRFGKMQ